MQLTFLGTRANVDIRSRKHFRHSVLRISHESTTVIIDCGFDWLRRCMSWRAAAIIVTHAHPDHAGGLRGGTSCPVYATATTWALLARYPIKKRMPIAPRRPIRIGSLTVEAIDVVHSLLAPAVGLRIAGGRRRLFYAPDLVDIKDRKHALEAVDLYVGDGSFLSMPHIRSRNDARIGHTSVRAQLEWCRAADIRKAIFTHCGTQVVRQKAHRADKALREMAAPFGVEARFAVDGMEFRL